MLIVGGALVIGVILFAAIVLSQPRRRVSHKAWKVPSAKPPSQEMADALVPESSERSSATSHTYHSAEFDGQPLTWCETVFRDPSGSPERVDRTEGWYEGIPISDDRLHNILTKLER